MSSKTGDSNTFAAIQTIDLTKKFKARRAVDDLSLTIDDGEVFALLGTNAAGNTTLIRMARRSESGDYRTAVNQGGRAVSCGWASWAVQMPAAPTS